MQSIGLIETYVCGTNKDLGNDKEDIQKMINYYQVIKKETK